MSWQVTIPMFLSKISIIELRYPQKGPDLKNQGKNHANLDKQMISQNHKAFCWKFLVLDIHNKVHGEI